MKLYGLIIAGAMGLSSVACASQVPATQQPKPAQPQQQRTNSTETKEKKKGSFLSNSGRFALGAGLVAISIFTGIKAKEEYKEGQTLLSKAKKGTDNAKDRVIGLLDKAEKGLDEAMSSSSSISPASEEATDWRSKLNKGVEHVRGEGSEFFNKVKSSCTDNPSQFKTAGWATTSVCTFILGMKFILEAVGFAK